jgi:hypothetical protein
MAPKIATAANASLGTAVLVMAILAFKCDVLSLNNPVIIGLSTGVSGGRFCVEVQHKVQHKSSTSSTKTGIVQASKHKDRHCLKVSTRTGIVHVEKTSLFRKGTVHG